MTAYDELMAFQRETEALAQVMGRLGWDQETVMPERRVRAAGRGDGGAGRGAARAAHRSADRRVAGERRSRRAGGARQPGLIRRRYERTLRVPAKTVGGAGAHDLAGAPGLGRGAGDRRFRGVRAEAGRGAGSDAREGGGAGGRRRSLRRVAGRLRTRRDGGRAGGDVRRAAAPAGGAARPGAGRGASRCRRIDREFRRGGAVGAVDRTGAGLRL